MMAEEAASNVLVVVATESGALGDGHQHRHHDQPVFVNLNSRPSEPASLTECARSVVSCASSSIRRSTISYQQRQARAQWKGLGSRCMWEACRATLLGLLLLVSGSIIVLVGFNAELPSMESAVSNRTNLLLDPKSLKRHKITYSYVGPVLIGIGGKNGIERQMRIKRCAYSLFILIGVGVATMEMRDMTAKVFPLTKRPTPRRKTSAKSNSQPSRLTAEAIGAMFQTPMQRVMREINASRLEKSRTVATQTLQLPWPSRRAGGQKVRLSYHGCRARAMSADQLESGRQRTILSLGSFANKRCRIERSLTRQRLFVRAPVRNSSAFSCPHLSTIS